jgi:tetratricopeptide (TPR) repeat protein
MRYNPHRVSRKIRTRSLVWLVLPGLVLLGWLIYQLPPVKERFSWRVELAKTYIGGVIHPAGSVPTPLPTKAATEHSTTTPPAATIWPPASSPTVQLILENQPTATEQAAPTTIPPAFRLTSPNYVLQEINNCGPASLAMYLDYYGWEGTQTTISDLIKPIPEDRNVNVEELVYYVRTQAGWLNAEFRVGGNIQLIKQFIAAGIPVMIEESFRFDEPFWPKDDLWAAHYLLLTGYDDARKLFITQDSFHGPDQVVEYQALDKEWQIFNRVFILVYPPSQQPTVESILGLDWDVIANRQRALETAQAEAQSQADNAYAWFNLGSNLVYFERYEEAAAAYDQARNLGLPQRMLRYQFGPFFAYFHTERTEDLLALTEYALQRTPNAEEALLWNGWALYRSGDANKAVEQFSKALEANPNYLDARYALEFIGATP